MLNVYQQLMKSNKERDACTYLNMRVLSTHPHSTTATRPRPPYCCRARPGAASAASHSTASAALQLAGCGVARGGSGPGAPPGAAQQRASGRAAAHGRASAASQASPSIQRQVRAPVSPLPACRLFMRPLVGKRRARRGAERDLCATRPARNAIAREPKSAGTPYVYVKLKARLRHSQAAAARRGAADDAARAAPSFACREVGKKPPWHKLLLLAGQGRAHYTVLAAAQGCAAAGKAHAGPFG